MPWRTGSKVPINVYDALNEPVCQCHNLSQATLIVDAVNALIAARQRYEPGFTAPDERGISGNACPDCGQRLHVRGTLFTGDAHDPSQVLFQCPACRTIKLV